MSCKPACNAPADCAASDQVCSADGKSCIPDGKVCHSNSECPKFNDCATDGMSCKPDAVLAAATARGVVPASWAAPTVRTSQEVAAELKRVGFREDSDGRVLIPGAEFGGVQLAFDPSVANPLTGLRSCLVHIQACIVGVGKWDECMAAMPRCEGETPWLGDQAGTDCCPAECLLSYMNARETKNPREAIDVIMSSSCYPGLRQLLDEAP
jgi:hypothetical protein